MRNYNDAGLLDYYPTDDDGWTMPFYIKPFPLVHNAVRGRFRPTFNLERGMFVDMAGNSKERAISLKMAEWMARKIISWDIQQVVFAEDGSITRVPLPITAENILALKTPLWLRLCSIVVWGREAGDEDPDTISEKTQAGDAEDELEALMKENQIIQQKLMGLQKN